jgi:hypothetical protein
MMINAEGSFAKKIAGSRNDLLFLVNGKSKKLEYWCIVAVDRLKLDIFKRKLGGAMRMQDYGKVLKWGYGSEPPESVLEEFRTKAA